MTKQVLVMENRAILWNCEWGNVSTFNFEEGVRGSGGGGVPPTPLLDRGSGPHSHFVTGRPAAAGGIVTEWGFKKNDWLVLEVWK